MSNFDKIREFHETFNHPNEKTPQLNVFKDKPKLVKLRLDLIREEVKELEEAAENHDMLEVVDALADILYVVYGAGAAFGIDLDEAYRLVHESNMTKVCATEQEAHDTVEWYIKNQLDVYDSPEARISANGKYWIVVNASTGKILKSIKYSPVDLKPVVFGDMEKKSEN
jgi:predicted HAD superfamily Cof-like phosphohydrolase